MADPSEVSAVSHLQARNQKQGIILEIFPRILEFF